MSIKVQIETRHIEVFGPAHAVDTRYYFSEACTVEFSLTGDADFALALAGDTVRAACRQHNGDYLRVSIWLHGKLVARWHGAVDAAIGEHLGEFVENKPGSGFRYTAQRIALHQEALVTDEIKLAREEAALDHERQADEIRQRNGANSPLAARFQVKADEFRRGKHDRSMQIEGYCYRLRMNRPAGGIQPTRILALAAA